MSATVKYCVWDVGQVVRRFSLQPLDKLMRNLSELPEQYAESGGVLKFDYKPVMKGEESFEKCCRRLADFCGVNWNDGLTKQIDQALHDGNGAFFEETKQVMAALKKKKIANCMLSNALPNLVDTGNVFGLVEDIHVFCSFDLGLLKPDPKIYETVRERLKCRFEEMIFVDDKPQNVVSAANLGIKGIVFKSETIVAEVEALAGSLDLLEGNEYFNRRIKRGESL